ncbi:cytochrome c oxidase subunit 3 [Mycolicibacterium sp.]|uniref:cytochrome c oxidase subunit 3 n=1 Tax=Mycolicibacterium sp. TaxID=2320850 RepID=UPI001A32E872|nr:cytochrome c oxidase subunit 3 [Mycolicibacterium sp.]MBJ7338338.1 cytochrome c oxidase subunit 3 [Mycolicibacterium sp.]
MTNAEQTATALPADPTGRSAAHTPGDSHVWVMVLGDLVIFGAYFLIFMIHRAMKPTEFLAAQQHLDITIGVVNTLVLLTSSLLIAQSVHAARADQYDRARRLIYGGGLCGVLFIIVKAYEWSVEIRGGFTLPSNDFFMFYFMLTGVHLFHVGLGLLFLGIVVRELRNPRRRRMSMVESGAVYWHMVDLLWIVIFGLLYVMR